MTYPAPSRFSGRRPLSRVERVRAALLGFGDPEDEDATPAAGLGRYLHDHNPWAPQRQRTSWWPRIPGPITTGRVRFDLARGVLMAWTGCHPDEAFTQLVTVARRHSVTVFDLADAILTVAHPNTTAPHPTTDPTADQLTAVVHRCWADHPDPAGHTHDPS